MEDVTADVKEFIAQALEGQKKIIADLALQNAQYEAALVNIMKAGPTTTREHLIETARRVVRAQAMEKLKVMISENEIELPPHKVPGWCR